VSLLRQCDGGFSNLDLPQRRPIRCLSETVANASSLCQLTVKSVRVSCISRTLSGSESTDLVANVGFWDQRLALGGRTRISATRRAMPLTSPFVLLCRRSCNFHQLAYDLGVSDLQKHPSQSNHVVQRPRVCSPKSMTDAQVQFDESSTPSTSRWTSPRPKS